MGMHDARDQRTQSVEKLWLNWHVSHYYSTRTTGAIFPHSPVLHYACKSLLTENNDKNNAIAMGLCAVFCCFLVVKQRTKHIEPHV